jgi:DNA-binding transcriptional LysR family regulator
MIGAFPSAAAGLVVPAVAELAARHPDLACVIREHEPEDGIALLRSGALDLLVSESYDDVPSAPVGGLESHRLLSEPLLLVTPPDGASELPAHRDADWIAGLAGTQFAAALDQACAAAGFVPRVVHRADDARLIQALVAAGLGVALLPELACAPAEGVGYREATPAPPRRHVDAHARRGATRRPALAAALSALRDVGPRSGSGASPR